MLCSVRWKRQMKWIKTELIQHFREGQGQNTVVSQTFLEIRGMGGGGCSCIFVLLVEKNAANPDTKVFFFCRLNFVFVLCEEM